MADRKPNPRNEKPISLAPLTLEQALAKAMNVKSGDIPMDDETKQKAKEIKSRIDDLRGEWDRLDASGSNDVQAGRVSDSIRRLQNKLKELTGEDY